MIQSRYSVSACRIYRLQISILSEKKNGDGKGCFSIPVSGAKAGEQQQRAAQRPPQRQGGAVHERRKIQQP
jgi:hypothetical protein